MLSDVQLQKIMPKLPADKLRLYLPPLNAAMQAHGIDSLLRTAAFVAQLAHESGEFRWMEEIWGPTPAQLRYEPPGSLAGQLGNTQAGDGKRFKGRGPIQITGRANYERFGHLLGVDLIAAPERAATPELAFAIAGLYWQSSGLNALADAQQFVTITRRINGGTNGLADRQMYYERAKAVLGVAARDAAVVAPMTRGYEAIAADAMAARRKPAAKKAVAKKAPAKKVAPAGKKPAARKTAAAKTPSRRKA